MNRSTVIILCIIAVILILAEAPAATARILVYAMILGGAGYGISLLAAQARERRPAAQKPPPAPTEEVKRWHQRRAEITSLPLDEAKRRAEEALANGGIWQNAEIKPINEHEIKQIPPSVAALFDSHGALQAMLGDARLGGSEIERFVWPGPDVLGFGETGSQKGVVYLKIGIDFDGNPIVVKPDQDTVFVVHRPESNPAKWWSADYPSIYHWMLLQDLA